MKSYEVLGAGFPAQDRGLSLLGICKSLQELRAHKRPGAERSLVSVHRREGGINRGRPSLGLV